MKIYRGIYRDVEALPGGANTLNPVNKRIDIIDVDNPYNVVLTSETVGINVEYTFTFDPLPAGAFQTQIMWSNDNGLTWNTSTGGTASPQTITLPASVYLFQFAIYFPDNVVYYWNTDNQVIPIEMSDDPVRDIVIDNDEDKFTVIRSRQLEIRIHSSTNITINTFASSDDKRFKVNHYVNDVMDFTGFLSTADLQQDFLPHPNVITLVAIDGLGTLADIPLRDFEGNVPQDHHRLLNYLLWSLYGTGLRLNVNIIFNIREQFASTLNADSNGEGHMFNYCGIDAKTFENGIGETEDMLTVIEKLLNMGASLFQYLGEWWVVRVDEQDFSPSHVIYKWDWEGTFIGKSTALHQDTIGAGDDHSFMNDDQIVVLTQTFKRLVLKYLYETPEEVPCNIDFERGDPIDDSGDEQRLTIDCWNLRTSVPPFISNNNQAYIVKKYTNGYINETYAEITFDTWLGGNASFLESSGIRVRVNGKISWGYDFRWTQDYTTGSGTINVNMCSIRLDADDGTVYFLDEDGEWYLSDGIWSVNYKIFVNSWSIDDVDDTEWRDFDNPVTESKPLPKSGRLYIMIHWENTEELEGIYLNIQNISFEYFSYTNGSYKKYVSQQHEVEQGVNNRNVKEEQVYISDSPEPLYKGALMRFGDTDWELCDLFYDALREPDGPVNLKRFGEIQLFDVWNQINRMMAQFEGEVDHTTPLPALVNRYVLSDASDNTANRYFILLHYELDYYLCSFSAFLSEVASSVIEKQYDGSSFKYITR